MNYSALKKRVNALEIVTKDDKHKIMFILLDEPSNWWECIGVEVGEDKHFIERVGNYLDKRTMLKLEDEAMQWARDDVLVNPPSGNYYKSYGIMYKMPKGVSFEYKQDFIIPTGAINGELKNIHDNAIVIK